LPLQFSKQVEIVQAACVAVLKARGSRKQVMALVNYAAREINCKIVYYGTGLGGKTTNLKYIHSQLAPTTRGELISLATETERTLFFDFLPLDLGSVQGFKTRFSLYTVPGQVEYNASRKLILNGVDGIIFVADSDVMRAKDNVESLQNMIENLAEYSLTLDNIPWVLQYNKRDLANAMPIERLEKDMNIRGVPSFEAVASEGLGVFATLKAISKLILNRLQ
jgi:signal recognition particle receptor subunit beta